LLIVPALKEYSLLGVRRGRPEDAKMGKWEGASSMEKPSST